MITRLTSVDQLKAGVKIFRIDSCDFKWDILEFVSVHPNNANYVIMLEDTTQEPFKKYKSDLIEDNWYLYDEEYSWAEIYAMLATAHEREYEHYKELALDELKNNYEKLHGK